MKAKEAYINNYQTVYSNWGQFETVSPYKFCLEEQDLTNFQDTITVMHIKLDKMSKR